MVMMGSLAAKHNNGTRPFKPRYIKAEEEDKTEVIAKGIIRIGTD